MQCSVSVFVLCVCVHACVCVRVRACAVQPASSANAPWKTDSVSVGGGSRQRSSSDPPAVHPPLPPLRVTSTSTFPSFSFLAVGFADLDGGGSRQPPRCPAPLLASCGLLSASPHGPLTRFLGPRPFGRPSFFPVWAGASRPLATWWFSISGHVPVAFTLVCVSLQCRRWVRGPASGGGCFPAQTGQSTGPGRRGLGTEPPPRSAQAAGGALGLPGLLLVS